MSFCDRNSGIQTFLKLLVNTTPNLVTISCYLAFTPSCYSCLDSLLQVRIGRLAAVSSYVLGKLVTRVSTESTHTEHWFLHDYTLPQVKDWLGTGVE